MTEILNYPWEEKIMRLGIVGAGMIVKDFLTITPSLKNMELSAIFGRKSSEKKINGFKKEYGIKNVFLDYDEFLNSGIDTVYIALPNNLHFEFAKKALEKNKNVIIEKPMTSSYEQAKILSDLAREKSLFVFEAITNQYLPNYKKIKELLPDLGNIKIVECNYSKYSSRYDKFKMGEILPTFDPKFSGGALMDLNIYNIHYAVGLFGKPVNVEYYPNIEKGIDTSGILIMDYEKFKCVCIGAKDCSASIVNNIQGDKGCIFVDTPVSVCKKFELLMNDGSRLEFNENRFEHHMVDEFLEFIEMIKNKDFEKAYKMLDHSLIVSEVQTIARRRSGVIFPDDNIEQES